MGTPFRLHVSVPGQEENTHEFDCDEVTVGRAADCSLVVSHAAMSRRQFTVRRVADKKFLLQPEPNSTNRTYGPRHLRSGAVIAVGHVRVRFEIVRSGKRSFGITAAVGVGLAGAIVFMCSFRPVSVADKRERAVASPDRLFAPQVPLPCAQAEDCVFRAREAFAVGRQLEVTSQANPANLYRAVVQYRRAQGYLKTDAIPLDVIPELEQREGQARELLENEIGDALFRLRNAAQERDQRSQQREAEQLCSLISDPDHPLRRRMDRLRERLGKDK